MEHPNGEGYLSWLRAQGFEDIYRTYYYRYGALVQAVNERYSKECGWGKAGEIRDSVGEVSNLFDISSEFDEQKYKDGAPV